MNKIIQSLKKQGENNKLNTQENLKLINCI